jgi:cell division transport system ATP-binding protein
MTRAEEPFIELANVSHRFPASPEEKALDGITFAVNEGAFVFITGPSGAGKSTLIRIISAEILPESGEVFVLRRNLRRLKRRHAPLFKRDLGLIHQEARLIETLSARDNVALALEVKGAGRREALARADEALDRVGLDGEGQKPVPTLSGGERQRVALARAIVRRPRLILADEPTGDLDPELSDEIFRLLDEEARRGATVVVASHDRRRIDAMRAPVLFIEDGRIRATRGDVEAKVR